MVQRIEAWGNVLEFPDDMPDADIAAAIQKNEAHLNPDASTFTKAKSAVSGGIDAGLAMLTPKKSIAERAQEQPALAPDAARIQRNRDIVSKALMSTEPVPEEGGFINSAGRTIGQNIKGAGQAAADFIPGVGQDNAVKRFGQDVIDANPTAVNSVEDIADKPGTAFTEATGNAVPSMAGMVGARALGQGITALSPLAGPAAPLVAAAGQVVSWLGPAAIASLPSYGGIRDKQILNDPANEKDAKAIAIATMGAAAVGAIEQAFGPQQWALAAMTKEGRVELAKKFAATTLPGAIGKSAVKGAAIEGAEELAQNPIEQLAAFDNPTTPENLKETLFGGAMGAIGGGVLGGGAPVILGKPVAEHSDRVLRYTAQRGGERAKAAAQAELDRRAAEGVDPAVANAPESTSEAVDRIISTGRDKADEIRQSVASESNAIQSSVFDEPDHVNDAVNMVDEATGKDSLQVQKTPETQIQGAPDSPTPEPTETLNAQLSALAEGRKPGVLLTPAEPLPEALPPDVRVAMVPNRGMLLYRDDATLQAALNGQMGTALGYGIDEKPGDATHVVTARDPNGTVIQDVATDGSKSVLSAAKDAAGPNGTVETRPLESAMAERAGQNSADVVMPDNTTLPAQWDVVDADSVTASLKEGVNQPRDRSRAASDVQVQSIANNPDYRRLSDSPVMDVGAPTLSHDGSIVGGNGRFEAVSRAYDQGSANDYLANLKADAVAKGINPAKIAGMKKPVLVRRITQPFDTRKLAVASNSGTGMQYSGLEMAKIDAGRMKGLENLEVTDSGDIALTGSNIQNVRHALGDYNAAELGSLTDKDGRLSQEGVRRIRNAMLYQAYGSNPTLERLVESTDNDLRNISGALVRAAGSAARVRADIQTGNLPADLDISADLVAAVETLSKIKANGMAVDEFLAQIGMFGEELSDQSKFILRALDANARSQKRIAEFIKTYYDSVARIDLSTNDIFGADVPTKQELLSNAKERITDKQPVVQDLFAKAANRPEAVSNLGAESAKQSANNGGADGSGKKNQQVTPPPSPKAEVLKADHLRDATKMVESANPLRPLVESLIKRRAAAKQGGKDLSNAIDRAKEVMDGKRADAIVENRWFRLQAKAFERADSETANILRQIAELVRSNIPAPIDKQKDSATESANTQTIEQQADAIEPAQSETKIEPVTMRNRAQAIGQETRIGDFGRKIIARKDIAVPLGKRGANLKNDDERPVWMQKYHAIRSTKTGKWTLAKEAGKHGQAHRVSRLEFDTEAQALASIPLAEVSRNHRVYSYEKDGQKLWGIYRNITDRKRALVKAGFASQEEAMKDMATNPVPIIEHKFPFPERPWLDRIERIGPERRTGNVTKEMFERTFGPSGVVYGNWLLNKDGTVNGDGQEISNHAYDSLLDLADAIGVPPKALFLNGELGLGLGALGNGGLNSAAAHYQPKDSVINLTKIKGAGTAAHEWWHAVDHYFAKQAGRDSSSVVAGGFGYKPTSRAELVDAIKKVVDTIMYAEKSKTTDADLIRQNAQKRMDGALRDLDYLLRDLRNPYQPKKPFTNEQITRWDELTKQLREGNAGEEIYIPPSANSRGIGFKIGANIKEMNDIYKAVTGRSFLKQSQESTGQRIKWIVKAISDNKEKLDAKDDEITTYKGRTEFYIEAKDIDNYRGSDYWSTPEEMGARAFEAYIFDKLVGHQKRSDYLVYAVENRFYADMKPYPEGSERIAIDNAFDNLFKVVQTEETDKGVALFSRSQNPDNFVKAPDGSVNFGEITKEIGGKIKRQAAPIRLPEGVQNSDGTGYGLAHIEANHGDLIRRFGYESVEAFVSHVAKDFSQIWQVSGRQLLVAVRSGRQDMMYVQLEPADDGDYYRVNSAFPVRQKDYPERHGFKVLWSGSKPALAVTGKQPAFAANPETSSSQDDPNARGQSDTTIPQDDPKFNRERINKIRERLKSASDKAKQATPPGGLSVSRDRKSSVQTLVDSIRSEWKNAPEVVVVSDMSDSAIPQRVRSENDQQLSQGAVGQPEGFFYKGKVYIVASETRSPADVARVLFHETLGHFGLRGAFGEDLKLILKQIAALRRADVEKKARQYGLDMSIEKDRLIAAEEVLAEMAQTNPQISFVKRAIAAIRAWLRKNIPALAGIKMTDAEIIHNFLIPARRFVQGGGATEREGLVPAFSRSVPGNNASWDAPEPSKIDDIIYKLQNKHVDLKRVMEAIRDTGAQLADQWNAYLQEELFHGRAAKRVQDFVNKELKPIIQGMRLRDLTVEELDQYLHARHAEEANKLIAQRDPNMPDGGSGMTTKDAKAYLAGLPADKKLRLENTAKLVDAVIAKTRDLYVSYGLIDQPTADSWKNMFHHYVPLMREDHDGGMGIGQGFSIKGKEVKHRTGSKRKVVDILANIALQRERAIVRGEKNRVAVSLAGLAKLNPNPDFWTFDKVPTEKVLNEATGQVEERPVPNFKNRDNVVVAKIKDSKGNVIERAVIFNEHDERAMRMAQALKNLDATQLEGLLGLSAKITRYFAAINTQYNPVFGIVNLTRDLQASLLNLSSTPIVGNKWNVTKNIGPAILAIYSSTRGDRKGKQATSPMAALWDEMQQEGGMTGYRDLFKTSEDRANAIKRELDPTAWMNSGLGKIFTAGGALKVPLAVAQKRAGWLFDWLSDYNQTLEGAMRLSVYKVAIDKGLSKAQAASIAKNISVNFNRKGQSGQQAGALYAFFNAAMQGTARIGETTTTMEKGDIKTFRFNRAGKTIIAGGITLGAMQALALAAAGFDDDEPPEFVRERSLIIPIGDKKYITVPMPLGFHAIPNIGRLSTEFALGGFKKPADYTAKLFAVFAEAFNPIGNAGLSIQTIAPTAIDPLVALAENRDWTGKPIAKEDFNKLSPTPGFARNKDTASAPSKWIAEAINTISGGNKYVPGVASPTADQIDYLFGQLTGGVGRETGKAQQTVSAIISGEELPPHKVPLVGRFYGNSENQSSQGNAFYSNLKRINEVEAELKGRRQDRLPIDEFKAENPEHRLVARANLVERLVSKQRKLKSELIEKDAPKEQVKVIDERITKLMAGLNQRVKELKQGQQAAH